MNILYPEFCDANYYTWTDIIVWLLVSYLNDVVDSWGVNVLWLNYVFDESELIYYDYR